MPTSAATNKLGVRHRCRRTSYAAALSLALACIIAQPSILAKASAVHLSPQNPQQWEASQLLIQGTQLLKTKEPFKARTLMERAEQLWPEEAHVHFNLAACYQEMAEFPKAIAEYQQALRIDNSMVECLPDIGTCFQLMGDYNQATVYFQQYLQRNPKAEDAEQIAGMIKVMRKQATEQQSVDPQSMDYLSSVLYNGRIQRWQLARLPLKVFISNGTDELGHRVDGFRENFNQILLDSLDTWVKASSGRLAYVLVDDANKADLLCTWTDRIGFLRDKGANVEQGAARVHSRQISNGEEAIMQVNLIVLLINPSSHRQISDEEVKKTCLHELGHALGFSGHSTNNRDVMFYSESPSVWASLTRRDSNTMARLYGDYPPSTAFQQPFVSGQPWPQQP